MLLMYVYNGSNMIATASPKMVVTIAMYIPLAINVMSLLVPNSLNVYHIPITVPISPINGATSIIVCNVDKPFIILLISTMKT